MLWDGHTRPLLVPPKPGQPKALQPPTGGLAVKRRAKPIEVVVLKYVWYCVTLIRSTAFWSMSE